MEYKLFLDLPQGWEVTDGGDGLEARTSDVSVQAVSGELPEDNGPEDIAFANYVDMVGFAPGEEDEQVLQSFMFNGRKAYGFSVFDGDGNIVNVFCQEPRRGMCIVFVVTAPDAGRMNDVMAVLEKSVRIRR